ncbi:unnamed protein product [Prunus armeniaca]
MQIPAAWLRCGGGDGVGKVREGAVVRMGLVLARVAAGGGGETVVAMLRGGESDLSPLCVYRLVSMCSTQWYN